MLGDIAVLVKDVIAHRGRELVALSIVKDLLDHVLCSLGKAPEHLLAAVFQRPSWDISFYLNTDAASLIGTDTFKNGEVRFRKGPIAQCAEAGGFGVLDEINMAKNESLAVLHATLDFRRIIDVPGYDRIILSPSARFIATMNYGYAGTRELNEALLSRFVVLRLPVPGEEELLSLFSYEFPDLREETARMMAALFLDIRKKYEEREISGRALDLRGLMEALCLIRLGLTAGEALSMGIADKCFDSQERALVEDLLALRLPGDWGRKEFFSSC